MLNERAKFVLRLEQGERMTDLCQEFGISRKTGYKIYSRFKAGSFCGLEDEKRGPRRAANKTAEHIQRLILDIKKDKPTWGARKIREILLKKYSFEHIPVQSTIHTILFNNNLVKKKRRNLSKYQAAPTLLSCPKNPNDLWCTDFKGQFLLQNKIYCYPLTITDQVSRFILSCEGFEAIKSLGVKLIFSEIFKEYGLPIAIRSDNGEPFSSRSIWGLSSLAIWWLRLGINLERIEPGNPQQNGAHERMHRTLKHETTRPAGKNLLHQQEIFDNFIYEFNNERPHEGIGMKTPSEIYKKSERVYPTSLPEIEYNGCDYVRRVSQDGTLYIEGKRRIFVSLSFRGQPIGISKIDDEIWELNFMEHTLGFVDNEINRLAVSENPFLLKSVT